VSRIADWCLAHRRVVVAAWLIFIIGMLALSRGIGADYRFSTDFPGSESIKAAELLQENSPAQSGETITIVWRSETPDGVETPEVVSSVNEALGKVEGLPQVSSVSSPYDTQNILASRQISEDGKVAFATVTLTDSSFNLSTAEIREIVDTVLVVEQTTNLEVAAGGQPVQRLSQPSTGLSEIIGFAVASVILLLAFGSLLSMMLPLFSAVLALGAALASVTFLSRGIDIPNFAPQLTALIGIGVGIDYALFVVTRHRSNLKRGMGVEESIRLSMSTAGRAVLFAGITVVIALSGLFVTGIGFLYGLAIAAAMGVIWTMLVTVSLLPAMLGFLGLRVLSRKERHRLTVEGPENAEEVSSGWMRWAGRVQKNPWVWSTAAIALMLALAAPVLSLRLGIADAGSDPQGSLTRTSYDMLADGFGPGFNGPLLVVAETPGGLQDLPAVEKAAADVGNLAGVASVTPVIPAETGKIAFFTAYPGYSPQDAETSELIETLRTQTLPSATEGTDVTFFVGGPTAVFNDFADLLQGKLPLFLLVTIGLSFLLLLVAFRSIAIPAKAAVMNLLAAAASFGVLVAVFQNGFLADIIGVSRTGPIDAFLPIMLLAILFGLSMDYQVFLVSRIHEEWVRTGDNNLSVRLGLGETGRVITAAALIMVSVFVSFMFGDDRIIKMFGLGLAVAIFLDAFIVRSVLVPALMLLLGKWNWWIPKWLDRILPRVSV